MSPLTLQFTYQYIQLLLCLAISVGMTLELGAPEATEHSRLTKHMLLPSM
jgi:hypothetical protein